MAVDFIHARYHNAVDFIHVLRDSKHVLRDSKHVLRDSKHARAQSPRVLGLMAVRLISYYVIPPLYTYIPIPNGLIF